MNNNSTVAELNIQQNNTLEYFETIRKRQYWYIIYDDSQKLTIDNLEDDILFLKKRIEEELGIDTKYQELTVDGKILKDNDKLESNGIIYGKEVHLKIKIGVRDFFPKGKNIYNILVVDKSNILGAWKLLLLFINC